SQKSAVRRRGRSEPHGLSLAGSCATIFDIEGRERRDRVSPNQTTMRASPQNRTLVIMAKAQKPGMVKTRLSQRLPSHAVTGLYRCSFKHTVASVKSL